MLSYIADSIINGVYESIKWHTAFIVCLLSMLYGTGIGNTPLIVSAAIAIVAFLVRDFVVRLPKWARYAFVGVIGMCAGLLSFPDIQTKVFGCFYYGFIAYYIFERHSGKAYFDDELRMSGAVIGVGALVTIFASTGTYASNVINSELFYLFFVVLYLIRLHLLNEYDNAALSISKKRNMIFFDVALIVLAAVFVFLGKNALVYFPKLIIGVFYVIFICIQYLWRFSYWLLLKGQELYLMLTGYKQGGYQDPVYLVEEPNTFFPEDEEWRIEELLKLLPDPTEQPHLIPSIISYVFVILTIILLIYVAVVFWPHPSHEENDVVAKTEKEFIFKPSDFLPKRFRKKKYFETESKNAIRKSYVKRVNEYHDKEVIMESYMTPNEFSRIVSGQHMDDDHSFADLTRSYNEVRYKDGE